MRAAITAAVLTSPIFAWRGFSIRCTLRKPSEDRNSLRSTLHIYRNYGQSIFLTVGIDHANQQAIPLSSEGVCANELYAETLSSLSILLRTVGRFIIRSCHTV